MFMSRIYILFASTVFLSCFSSIHGWLFYKKPYYPYATREYNGNSNASPSQTNTHAQHTLSPNSNWVPVMQSGSIYYNEPPASAGIPVTVALPVAIPAAVYKDNVYQQPGSAQSVPIYMTQSGSPQGLPVVVNHPPEGTMKQYTYGPCMCTYGKGEQPEAQQPEQQTTRAATPTRETYVVQPISTTTT